MLLNYLKIACRNLIRNKPFFFINTLGLAIGIAACLLILQYVIFERSYDNFHPDADNSYRIYRIELDSYQNGKLAFRSATSYPAIAPTLKKDFPEVVETTRLYDANSEVVTYNNVHFREDNFYFADNTVFNFFKLDFLNGEPKTALKEKNTVVLSETTARKYFGAENPLGKTIKLGRDPYLVKGVYKDYPKNSHLELDLLFSYLTAPDAQTNWGWYDFFTYVKLRPGTDVNLFQSKIINLVKKYVPNRNRDELLLQPLRSIHLASQLNQEAEPNGNGRAVTVLSIIALFILVIAWINYINLATARAMDRAKEVGVRKVVGASVPNLIGLLSKDFIKLVIAAILIAWPIARYAITRWLSDFAYYIAVPWWSFVVAGISALGIALLTVSFQSVKAALMNPVRSLRNE